VAVVDVAPPPPAAKSAAPSNGAAIGGAVGGVVVALLLGAGAYFVRRQRAELAQTLAAGPKVGDALGGDGSPVLRQNPMARGMVRTHSKKFVVSSLVPVPPSAESQAPGGTFEAENPLNHANAHATRVEMPPTAAGGGAAEAAAPPGDAAPPGAAAAAPGEPGAAPPAPADPAAPADAAAPPEESDDIADAKARARAAHDAGELPPKWDWDTADDGEI